MQEKLIHWTIQLRQEQARRRRAQREQPDHVSYHRQREQIMRETIEGLRAKAKLEANE
ncbi:MAG: hypothetical protein NWQ99_08895 [Porticoccaceae bacterium]|nr:hypothetical protein [Porticoccaceae bacterium]